MWSGLAVRDVVSARNWQICLRNMSDNSSAHTVEWYYCEIEIAHQNITLKKYASTWENPSSILTEKTPYECFKLRNTVSVSLKLKMNSVTNRISISASHFQYITFRKS